MIVELVLIFGLFTNNDDSRDTTTQSITTATEESYHLTDNDVIYRIEDYKDVQTMYLTVTCENDSDNTSHL